MENYLKSLNLIDLISEKHKELRKLSRTIALSKGIEDFCDNKIHLLSLLTLKKMTIAESARHMDISRQAVHKFSKILLEKNLIFMEDSKDNHKEKFMNLTESGQNFCDEMFNLKNSLENEIIKKIGKEKIEILRSILLENWD
ncbi:MAG: hypothetical protein JXM74_07810 [Fusobacteriaceae bacterium]|nr:hypothetical protein [Fusobacteriaceae bacterium]MBN2838648.1 hypothetical protein [Fusobacteriaceae bacterium]